MKKILLTFTFLFTFFFVHAQLNGNASYIKEKYPSEYENTFKKHALEKWETDYEMVVYMINNQVDALINTVKAFESDNTQIVFEAIQKWSFDGYKSSNIEAFKKLENFSIESLVKLHCDWEMVKYTYDNQVQAKNSF